MASPPEVHAALLSAGPGPDSLVAAVGSWTSLAAEYANAAEHLDGLLITVETGPWQGVSAMCAMAAYAPYLDWLMQASADCSAMAHAHQEALAVYVDALAAMPTLAELSANHALHAMLTNTNFFGITTIPITFTEADYLRMWIQAATTMSAYETVSVAALATVPHIDPAPTILKRPGTGLATSATAADRSPESKSTRFYIMLYSKPQ